MQPGRSNVTQSNMGPNSSYSPVAWNSGAGYGDTHAETSRYAQTAIIVVLVAAVGLCIRLLSDLFVRKWVLGYALGSSMDRHEESLSRKLGQLPFQLACAFCFPTMGGLAFLYSGFSSAPFTGWSSYLDVAFAVFLGNFVAEFIVASSTFPTCVTRCPHRNIHILLAIAFYSLVLDCKQDPLLGVVGMIMYYTNFHVYLHSFLKSAYDSKHCFVNLVVWLFAVCIVGVLIPLVVVITVSTRTQGPFSLPLFHFIVFVLASAYLMGLYAWQIRRIIHFMAGGTDNANHPPMYSTLSPVRTRIRMRNEPPPSYQSVCTTDCPTDP